MGRAYRVALTGGIACGKTTVAQLFAALGASIVDTDLLSREVVAPGSALLPKIAAHFGDQVLQKDGSLDRAQLRERVFANPAERQWLESVTHPAIRELTDARCETATGRYVIVAIPLLVETQGAKRFERVLVVDCEPALQLARLQARDGMTRSQAERMLAAQATREQRLAVADDVVRNDGDLATLRIQVERLHRQYSQLASAQADRART
jgi:dephospho-CoA kinase